MALSPKTYTQLENNFVAWARMRPDIRAAIVIGSRARIDPPPDHWSDLDIILYTTHPDIYVANTNWLYELGEIWIQHLNYTFAQEAEWIVLFAGGLKADFILSKAAGTLQQIVNQSPYHVVFQRGIRPLFDKDGHNEFREAAEINLSLPKTGAGLITQPAQAEFLAAVSQALLSAARTAKLLKRGELWQAKEQCDTDLKLQLLRMLEWHACTTRTTEPDVWYEGRFLDQWAAPAALKAIPDTFAHYDMADMWRALFATLDLFRQLAIETALHLEYTYPAQADKQVTAWLKAMPARND